MAGETFASFLVEDPAVSALSPPFQAGDLIPVVRGAAPNEVTYRAPLSMFGPLNYSYVVATEGATLTAAAGLGAYVLNPAAPLTALHVVAPPTPGDGQIFEVTTTNAVATLTVTAPAGATVRDGVHALATDRGTSWRYVALTTTWYKRF